MYQLDLNSFPLMDVESALDPTRRVRVGFPHHSQVGNASTATVYFELDPGMHVGMHRDSSEELLLILEGEGEATIGEETAVAQAGAMLTVPAMEPHDIRNVGERHAPCPGLLLRADPRCDVRRAGRAGRAAGVRDRRADRDRGPARGARACLDREPGRRVRAPPIPSFREGASAAVRGVS